MDGYVLVDCLLAVRSAAATVLYILYMSVNKKKWKENDDERTENCKETNMLVTENTLMVLPYFEIVRYSIPRMKLTTTYRTDLYGSKQWWRDRPVNERTGDDGRDNLPNTTVKRTK